jgi:HlyD family secretion protein
MQVIANIDQADIGLVEQAKSVKFTVDAFPNKEYDGQIQQMRLNPQNVQNVVTYNVVIDVGNPEQKLKPGMTANLTITIDERNNVLKVSNAALRYIPQNATGQQSGNATGAGSPNGQGRRKQPSGNTNDANDASGGNSSSQQGSSGDVGFAPPTAPVLAGQTRVVWVLGADGKPQSRRIKVGLTDGVSTEVVEGNLQEGEMVITGQTITSTSKAQTSPTPAPGFGGATRTGVPAGGRRN